AGARPCAAAEREQQDEDDQLARGLVELGRVQPRSERAGRQAGPRVLLEGDAARREVDAPLAHRAAHLLAVAAPGGEAAEPPERVTDREGRGEEIGDPGGLP